MLMGNHFLINSFDADTDTDTDTERSRQAYVVESFYVPGSSERRGPAENIEDGKILGF